jgi:hypothetical protein
LSGRRYFWRLHVSACLIFIRLPARQFHCSTSPALSEPTHGHHGSSTAPSLCTMLHSPHLSVVVPVVPRRALPQLAFTTSSSTLPAPLPRAPFAHCLQLDFTTATARITRKLFSRCLRLSFSSRPRHAILPLTRKLHFRTITLFERVTCDYSIDAHVFERAERVT